MAAIQGDTLLRSGRADDARAGRPAPRPGDRRRGRRPRRDQALGRPLRHRARRAAPPTWSSRWRWSGLCSTTTSARRPATTSAATTPRTWPRRWSRRRRAARRPGGATGKQVPGQPPRPSPRPRSTRPARGCAVTSAVPRPGCGAGSTRSQFRESTLGVSGVGPLEWYFETSAVPVDGAAGAVDNTYYRLGRGLPGPVRSGGPGGRHAPGAVRRSPTARRCGPCTTWATSTRAGSSRRPARAASRSAVTRTTGSAVAAQRDRPAAVHGPGDRRGHGRDARAPAGPVREMA